MEGTVTPTLRTLDPLNRNRYYCAGFLKNMNHNEARLIYVYVCVVVREVVKYAFCALCHA